MGVNNQPSMINNSTLTSQLIVFAVHQPILYGVVGAAEPAGSVGIDGVTKHGEGGKDATGHSAAECVGDDEIALDVREDADPYEALQEVRRPDVEKPVELPLVGEREFPLLSVQRTEQSSNGDRGDLTRVERRTDVQVLAEVLAHRQADHFLGKLQWR